MTDRRAGHREPVGAEIRSAKTASIESRVS
jgi:hypothetical protein